MKRLTFTCAASLPKVSLSWKRMTRLICLAALIVVATVAIGVSAEDKPQAPKLWAGVSASNPNSTSNALFTTQEAEKLVIGFALVNDGEDSLPFERGETELIVNGKPLAGFGNIFRKGPVWDRMVPGKPFSAALGLGKHFVKPSVYKVQWRGKGFESAVLEFRVMTQEVEAAALRGRLLEAAKTNKP